ncbi:formate dehydrogenase accessory protein FdhE [Geotalea sp. SG265]|uniref:formate dehydrogenase accessory protein FdhE n=1 Tax=Geotalea sp. SG265 TaxID=2922867 RepID=UPI001FAFEDE0|nr:formate dehydrogenase accessory protein FdhE [Geotalea sp. SG265]
MPTTAVKLEFLRRTAGLQPEYGEILPLFQALYNLIDGQEGRTGIRFNQPVDHVQEKIRNGFPLLAPEHLEIDAPQTIAFLAAVIDTMLQLSREGLEELQRLRQAIVSGELDLQALFVRCLFRERAVVEEVAARLAIPSPLMEFVLEIPLKTALELYAEAVLPEQVEGWSEGYCPICGSRAGMGEICGEDGRRFLSCSSCFFKWPYKRLKCPYCGNDDPETLSYFMAGEGPTRVDICRACSRYLKTRDTRLGHADVPLEAEDLATIHLDLVAGKEGFERGK